MVAREVSTSASAARISREAAGGAGCPSATVAAGGGAEEAWAGGDGEV